jgi:alkylation response protein AidB-like acyl-CoA dehydrogenase
LLAFRAGWASDAKDRDALDLTNCAKVFCAESAEKVAGSALQILSGAGYVAPNPAERAFRNSKYSCIAGTSSEIARMEIGDAALSLR